MIETLCPSQLSSAPVAVVDGGMAVCPCCGKVLAQPLSGQGRVAVWCRRCRWNVVVEL